MAWKVKCSLHLREEFVLRATAPGAKVAPLCREYAISRKTGYKWLDRYKQLGIEGLLEMGRRPHRSPLRVDADTVLEVIRLRQMSGWGPRKIVDILKRERPGKAAPSARTVARILGRAQMVTPRPRRRRWTGSAERPRCDAAQPNDLWTVDFKGWWQTRDGQHCEPLTVRDAMSRFVLCLQIHTGTATDPVRRDFERLFRIYGLPRAIQSDNGVPFVCTRNPIGLTSLAAWWISLGIELVRSRKASPQDNGAHERMHADIYRELQMRASLNAFEQQKACDRWRRDFNHVRPHEALAMKRPADCYKRSLRNFHDRPVLIDYPQHLEVRTVDRNGSIKYGGKRFFVSEALRGLSIALEDLDDQTRRIWFCDKNLGALKLSISSRRNKHAFVWNSSALLNAPQTDNQ
jgi:putative transposase